MSKLYYTDPLKAEHMAQEFGIIYMGYYAGYNDICDRLSYLPEWWNHNRNDFPRNRVIKFYIHPDCYEMLKPQVGDFICLLVPMMEMENEPLEYCVADGRAAYFLGKYYTPKSYRIAERNGKAFFMPEVQDD